MGQKREEMKDTEQKEGLGETEARTIEVESEDEAGFEETTEGEGEDASLASLLEEKTRESEQNHAKYLRARADLDNYKKRSAREKALTVEFANETLIDEILPVIDNLERALEHANEAADTGALGEGVRLTIDQMFSVLKKFGLEEISALGCKFDPELHHAISHKENDSDGPEVVVEEFQKGYKLKGRLLRPSMVAVAKAASGDVE